jgi:hypothetical protein
MSIAASRTSSMAEPVGAMVKSREPSRAVECGDDCPVGGDDQYGVTGSADHIRRNAVPL